MQTAADSLGLLRSSRGSINRILWLGFCGSLKSRARKGTSYMFASFFLVPQKAVRLQCFAIFGFMVIFAFPAQLRSILSVISSGSFNSSTVVSVLQVTCAVSPSFVFTSPRSSSIFWCILRSSLTIILSVAFFQIFVTYAPSFFISGSWLWTPNLEKSFENLKQLISKALILKLFDPKDPIEIQTDAS